MFKVSLKVGAKISNVFTDDIAPDQDDKDPSPCDWSPEVTPQSLKPQGSNRAAGQLECGYNGTLVSGLDAKRRSGGCPRLRCMRAMTLSKTRRKP